ncbi:MAG: sugar ABC transporter permease [Clostridiales bacterium]|nr:sugar ABC transporter permease [Clostridiales bacterium]
MEAKRAKVVNRLTPRQQSDSWFGFALVVPALLVLLIVIALPILKGIYVSFFSYKLKNVGGALFNLSPDQLASIFRGDADLSSLSNLKWNDLANYISLFKRGEVLHYFRNTLVFVAFTVSIQLVLGMVIALLLNSKIRACGLYRGFMLIPWTIPSVVVAILWRWMLHQDFGVINYIAYALGISQQVNVSWQVSDGLAMASIVLASVWRQLPYMMVMLLAGLQSVDGSLEEASRIDGANGWNTFTHVILPSIRPVLFTSVWIAVMNNFQSYTIIANMNGTGASTMTLSIAAYQEAFKSYNFGKGAAIGVMWLVLLFMVTLVTNRMNERCANDYQ